MKLYKTIFHNMKEQMLFMEEWEKTTRQVKVGLERRKNNEQRRIKKSNGRSR